MRTRRIRACVTAVSVAMAMLILLSSCGFQKFPEDRTVDTVPPDPPTNLVALGGDQQVDLTWTLSASTDVVDYNVYVRLDSDTTWGTAISVGGSLGGLIVTGLTNGENYWARVQALDAFGNESQPESAAEVSFVTTPDPPTGLAITVDFVSGFLELDLTWTPSPSPTVTGYTVLVSTDGGMTWPTSIDVANVVTYTLTNSTLPIQYGTSYDIAIQSYDDPGPAGLRSIYLTGQILTPPAPPPTISGIPGDNLVT
ncbi:MAG: fibronectin type III domain-containing protein, partial [Planctomycetota bacterium]